MVSVNIVLNIMTISTDSWKRRESKVIRSTVKGVNMKLKDLPIGSNVKDVKSDRVFLVAAQNHPGYMGTTLISKHIVGVGCFDGKEPKHFIGKSIFCQVDEYGWNMYPHSNIHQWLNAEEECWYTKSHLTDMPPKAKMCRYGEQPYFDKKGFLYDFSEVFKESIHDVEIECLHKTARDCGEIKKMKAKVFLPSRTEIGKGDECGRPEGKMLPLFHDYRILKAKPNQKDIEKYGRSWNPARKDAPYDAPQIYDPKYGWWYWLRTAHMGYDFLNRVVSPYGAVSYTYSNNDIVGIRPVLNLVANLDVISDGALDETYTIAI